MWPPITITITITGNIWPDYYYYYYYYSGILKRLLLLLLLSLHKCVITITITITISNSLTTLICTLKKVLHQLISYIFFVHIGTSRFNQHFINSNKMRNAIHNNDVS